MEGWSSITTVDFQFKIFISIVNTIAVFCFQEKEKKFQKTKRKKGSYMLKKWTSEVQILALTWSKPKPKEVKTAGSNMPKIWTNKEERRSSSNKPKIRAEMKKKVTLTSSKLESQRK